ncbi:uncharacterized protein [Coffea arabica]|uniref:SWIM-type domain-containing protein n=1 Tax=Coffea arabica TaxID=13443 RepID=A0ABM4VZI6_COFAR
MSCELDQCSSFPPPVLPVSSSLLPELSGSPDSTTRLSRPNLQIYSRRSMVEKTPDMLRTSPITSQSSDSGMTPSCESDLPIALRKAMQEEMLALEKNGTWDLVPFPSAYAAAEGESKDSWCWFFKLLKEDLKVEKDYEWTIMSDKQKSLIEACDMIFPNAAHRFCVKHLHNNFSSVGFKGEGLRRALWTIVKATIPAQFISRMEAMAEIDIEAANKILDAREKPIIDAPFELAVFEKNIDRTPDYFPFKSNDDLYEVSCPYGDQYVVNIKEQTCSCRKWELTGIPCPHAIAALWMAKKNPLLYISKWYTVETYMKCYEGSVCPMNGESEWRLTNVGEGPLPPLYRRAPGRPKKPRRRSVEEVQQAKEKTKKKVTRVG